MDRHIDCDLHIKGKDIRDEMKMKQYELQKYHKYFLEILMHEKEQNNHGLTS